MRWFWWFVLAPFAFVLGGLWCDAGLPPIDVAVLVCAWLALFAHRTALPGLLLGAAVGRALVDEATLPVQILVLGVPVAVLVPLRGLVSGQHWLFQVATAAGCAVCVPKLAGLCGRLFDQPSASATLVAMDVVWAAALVPLALFVLRRLPPFHAFAEPAA
jgi:hypothetical protein